MVARLTDDQRVVQSLHAFERWAESNEGTRMLIAPGSAAAIDLAMAGGDRIVPSGIIEMLINSTTDHLLAWRDKSLSADDPPVIRLSAYADFTLLRPPIEALANVVWVLSPEDPRERISRSLRYINIELQHGKKLVSDLSAAGTPDEELADTFARSEPRLRDAAAAAGLNADQLLSVRTIDQSRILRSIGTVVGGSTYQVLLHWARASAHAHSQVLTTLTLADRAPRRDAGGPYLYSEVSSASLADSCDLLMRLMNVAVGLLDERGFRRV
jgi:hypothetical protein